MSVLFIVLPIALALAALAVGAFIWAVHRGQLDDLETPAIRVAFEDAAVRMPEEISRAGAAERDTTSPRRGARRDTPHDAPGTPSARDL